MAVFLLDTSVIIDALNQRHDRPQLLADLLHKGHTLACCPINVAEVYAGLRPLGAPDRGTPSNIAVLPDHFSNRPLGRLAEAGL